VDNSDNIPKTIDNCDKEAGDIVTVKMVKILHMQKLLILNDLVYSLFLIN